MNHPRSRWFWIFLTAVFAACAARASVQTFSITTPGGANAVAYGVSSGSTNFGANPTVHLKIGLTYTLAINCDSAHLFFLTTNPAAGNCNNNANYYLQHTAAFSSSVLASPQSVATVDFTPPAADTIYFFWNYVADKQLLFESADDADFRRFFLGKSV